MEVQIIENIPRVVRISGDLAFSDYDELESIFSREVGVSPGGFVIDLTSAGYMDSTSVAAIIGAYRSLWPTHGQLAIVAGSPKARRVLELIRPNDLPGMFLCDDLSSAMKAFDGSKPPEV